MAYTMLTMSCQIPFLDNVKTSNVCYAASTSLIISKLLHLSKQDLSLMHINFAEILMILSILKLFTFEQASQLHSLAFSKHDTIESLQNIFPVGMKTLNFMSGCV